MPQSTELLRDIHESNLMYLLLLRRMARSGNPSALAGVQVSARACEWLARQDLDNLTRLSRCSVVLAQLSLEPPLLLAALSQGMDEALAREATPLRTLA